MTRQRESLSYRDIKNIVLDRIRGQIWPPNSLLPTETVLAAELSSSRLTVNRALRELANEGYLQRNRKAGTRVLSAPIRTAQFTIPLVRDEITQSGAEYRYSLVERRCILAPEWLTSRLNLCHAQSLLHLRCMHYANNKPFQYEVRWVVIASVPSIIDANFTEAGPNDWLVKHVPFTNIDLSFLASQATENIANFLDTVPGTPLFSTERLTWLGAAPVTLARLYFAPGYRLTTHI